MEVDYQVRNEIISKREVGGPPTKSRALNNYYETVGRFRKPHDGRNFV